MRISNENMSLCALAHWTRETSKQIELISLYDVIEKNMRVRLIHIPARVYWLFMGIYKIWFFQIRKYAPKLRPIINGVETPYCGGCRDRPRNARVRPHRGGGARTVRRLGHILSFRARVVYDGARWKRFYLYRG